jgi:hypothetical protein
MSVAHFLHHPVAGQQRSDLVFLLEGLEGKRRIAGPEDPVGAKIHVELLL